jgi:hypothetical protein
MALLVFVFGSCVVLVDEVLDVAGVGDGLGGSGSLADCDEGQVHAASYDSLLKVVNVGCQDDFVGGHRGLDGVLVQVSAQDDTAHRGSLFTKGSLM